MMQCRLGIFSSVRPTKGLTAHGAGLLSFGHTGFTIKRFQKVKYGTHYNPTKLKTHPLIPGTLGRGRVSKRKDGGSVKGVGSPPQLPFAHSDPPKTAFCAKTSYCVGPPLVRRSEATCRRIYSTIGRIICKEMLSQAIWIATLSSLLFVGAGSRVQLDLLTTSHKFSMGFVSGHSRAERSFGSSPMKKHDFPISKQRRPRSIRDVNWRQLGGRGEAVLHGPTEVVSTAPVYRRAVESARRTAWHATIFLLGVQHRHIHTMVGIFLTKIPAKYPLLNLQRFKAQKLALPETFLGHDFRFNHTDVRKWESCRTMPLVGGFSRGSPISPTPLHSSIAPYSPRFTPQRLSRPLF
ncbi:hypothetical protein PR048_002269 [Dryococelus australis]|uniref:Ribosomal protein L2 n=1 Tax=Dryococelus australis TaxID=614101 RepID=A0ABQ9IJQ5_9NEOP|nr:hypothetical protein PR048_002269 [Dryococelus australis]